MGKVGRQDGACRPEVDGATRAHIHSAHNASPTRGRYKRTASAAWRSTHANSFGSSACPDEATGSIPVGASPPSGCAPWFASCDGMAVGVDVSRAYPEI